jgi:hypothetical protein
MKLAVQSLIVATMLSSAAAGAPSNSPFLGRWAVDVAHLPMPAAQRPKGVTMTFSDAGGGKWTTTVDIVGPDGSDVHSVATYALDGVPAPITPDGEYDHVAITNPAPNVLVMALSKAGTPGTTRIYTLSPDRNTDVETHVYQTPAGPLSMKTAEWKRMP